MLHEVGIADIYFLLCLSAFLGIAVIKRTNSLTEVILSRERCFLMLFPKISPSALGAEEGCTERIGQ